MSMAVPRCLTMVAMIVAMSVAVVAQPNVEIFHDDNNRADTVMDFGVTLEGYPVTVAFYVRNKGTADVGILLTNPNADPYYQIVNTPDVLPADPRKEEFERVEGLPYIVKAMSTDTFHIVYKALKNNPVFPPDVVAKALLELRVVALSDSLGRAVTKRFLLLALKTKFSVATNKPAIPFDSVYINPTPQPPGELYSVVNASSIAIPVEQQRTSYLTSIVGKPEFIVDTLTSPIFAPHKNLTWNVRYQPHNMGPDSAHFVVLYRPNQGSDADSVVTKLSGVGVEQKIEIDAANGTPPPIAVKPGEQRDTIDFGDVDADGSGGKLARIVVKNVGNIHVRYMREYEEGAGTDTTAFIVERQLGEGGLGLRTNEYDTLIVRFKPVNGGVHIITYTLLTDLLERQIQGIPDGAERTVFVLRGFARKPQVEVLPQQVDFGSVVLIESCPSASERTVLVRNVGNILLRVDSALISPSSASVEIRPPNPIQPIEVDSTLRLTLRYQPTQLETMQSELVLYTNAFGPPIRIPLTGASLRSDSITVSIPQLSNRPGTVLQVPIVVDANRVNLTTTATMTVGFDPTLLRYRGSLTNRTASEGSVFVTQAESPRGVLNLQLRTNGTFMARDTFVVLLFDTYLGRTTATELSIKPQTTMFGNDGCSSLLSVHTRSGLYAVDSVCGLEFKTNTTGMLRLQVFPNPTTDFVYVEAASADEAPVTVEVFDVYGQRLPEPPDSSAGGYNLKNYPAGMYVVVARTTDRYVQCSVIKQ